MDGVSAEPPGMRSRRPGRAQQRAKRGHTGFLAMAPVRKRVTTCEDARSSRRGSRTSSVLTAIDVSTCRTPGSARMRLFATSTTSSSAREEPDREDVNAPEHHDHAADLGHRRDLLCTASSARRAAPGCRSARPSGDAEVLDVRDRRQPDAAALLEPADATADRALGHAEPRGDLAVADARIDGQQVDDAAIEIVVELDGRRSFIRSSSCRSRT